MTAATSPRLTDFSAPVPSRGTLPIAADTLLVGGCIVCRNATGYAVDPTDGDGFPAMGIACNTYDNRTEAPSGGAAGAMSANVQYGCAGFDIDGDTPLPGDLMFVVDNQTVSKDSDSGARGVAGYCVEVRTMNGTAQAFVWFGPHVMGQVEEVDLAAAEAAIADLEADVAQGVIAVPIVPYPVWADGTTNGFDAATHAYGFNPTIDNQLWQSIVTLPEDLDADEDVIVMLRASISSIATDNDVTMLLDAYFDGGSDVAPTVATILSVAAQEILFTIPAASVPAGAKSLHLAARADNNLDTADAYLTGVEVRFTKAIASA